MATWTIRPCKRFAAIATGMEPTYIGLMGVALSILVVGQVTGALLVAKLIVSGKNTWFYRPLPLIATRTLLSNYR